MIELLDILIALVSSKLLSAQQATTLPLPQRRPMRSPAATVRYCRTKKPNRSAHVRILVRLRFGVTKPPQTAANSDSRSAAHAP
jgi:hypothetical protein